MANGFVRGWNRSAVSRPVALNPVNNPIGVSKCTPRKVICHEYKEKEFIFQTRACDDAHADIDDRYDTGKCTDAIQAQYTPDRCR